MPLDAVMPIIEKALARAAEPAARLRELPTKWRSIRCTHPQDGGCACEHRTESCADDLEQALSTLQSSETAKLMEALKDANSLCRSAYSIAEREGLQTNWDAFRKQLLKSLERQKQALAASGDAPCYVCGEVGKHKDFCSRPPSQEAPAPAKEKP